jgi:hypothetical protein
MKDTKLLLRVPLDLQNYKAMMLPRPWSYFQKGVVATRDYEAGLQAGHRLLHFAQEHKGRLSAREYRWNRVKLCGFILEMLDRLDLWQEYLWRWEEIKTATGWELHKSRRKIVERKLELRRAGRRVGNLFHPRRKHLSTDEYKKRSEWVKRWEDVCFAV